MCANYVKFCAVYEIKDKNFKAYGIILLQFMLKSEVERKKRYEIFQ